MEKYIVRADFYPNGKIIPLGITDERGYTSFVDEIVSESITKSNEYKLECIVDDKRILLVLRNNKWSCEEI